MTACIVGWSHSKFGKHDGVDVETLLAKAAADAMALTQPGCLFVSFVYEQVPDTDGVRPLITAAIELWRSRIAEKLVLAQEAGRLADDVDVDSLADHVFTTFEGAFILARATRDATHVRAQLGHLRRYLELLLDVAPT